MKEQDETPDQENAGDVMRGLFDMEQGIERNPSTFRIVLREVLDRIIEKRLEYYLPLEEDEKDAGGPFGGLSHAG